MSSTPSASLYTASSQPSSSSTYSFASTPPGSVYPTTTKSPSSNNPPPSSNTNLFPYLSDNTNNPPPSTSLSPKQTPTTNTYPPLNATTFTFPRTHAFPPFYTLQPTTSTLHAQLQKWSSIILSYHAFHKLTKLSVSASLNSELFWNKQIGRRLDERGVREVLGFMRREGRVEFVNAKDAKDGKGGDVCWVWWRSVEEWGGLIESWVGETGQKNTVLTLYELTESDATIGQDFHGLDPELLQKALSTLVKRGKAQIFGQEDQQGVKFF